MKRAFSAALLVYAAMTLAPEVSSAGQLRAGAAKISITPSSNEFPFPYEADKSCEPKFEPGKPCNFVDVHDPIFARALMLDDGSQGVVVVEIESVSVPDSTDFKQKIADAVGVPIANVLLAATHTHETLLVKYRGANPSPAQKREIDRVEAGAIAAARSAKAALRPARIAFARGKGWINVNNGDSIGTAGYNPAGPSDHSLDVIRLVDEGNHPIAMLVNYATHGEVMYRSVTKDGGYEVTGDVPGMVAATLEALPAAAPVVVYTAAAEGDQMTLFKSLQGAEASLSARDEGASGYALLDEMSRRLSLSVLDAVGSLATGADHVSISAASGAAICPGQQMEKEESTGKVTVKLTGPVAIPVNVLRIGDIALVGIGADLASEIGIEVKRRSPVPQTTLVSVAAGSVGYVLADSSFARASHGVIEMPIRPHCAEEAISETVDRLINALDTHKKSGGR